MALLRQMLCMHFPICGFDHVAFVTSSIGFLIAIIIIGLQVRRFSEGSLPLQVVMQDKKFGIPELLLRLIFWITCFPLLLGTGLLTYLASKLHQHDLMCYAAALA